MKIFSGSGRATEACGKQLFALWGVLYDVEKSCEKLLKETNRSSPSSPSAKEHRWASPCSHVWVHPWTCRSLAICSFFPFTQSLGVFWVVFSKKVWNPLNVLTTDLMPLSVSLPPPLFLLKENEDYCFRQFLKAEFHAYSLSLVFYVPLAHQGFLFPSN